MQIKTGELTGPALDWAVATLEKLPRDVLVVVGGRPIVHRTFLGEITELRCEFSAHWSQGGPIIEREKLTLEWTGEDWMAYIRHDEEFFGSTPLIAAMRCYAASKLGDEIDVPDDIV